MTYPMPTPHCDGQELNPELWATAMFVPLLFLLLLYIDILCEFN